MFYYQTLTLTSFETKKMAWNNEYSGIVMILVLKSL